MASHDGLLFNLLMFINYKAIKRINFFVWQLIESGKLKFKAGLNSNPIDPIQIRGRQIEPLKPLLVADF